MKSQDHDRAGELFLEARGLPPDDRAAFLQRACSGNDALRDEVASLLEADARASMLDDVRGIDLRAGLRELADEIRGSAERPAEAVPKQIGPYRIVRKIGQGGMGAVYEAEQQSPRRRVALKVIRRSIISRQLLSRFQLEAQVLGQLQHPGIAQIYEASTGDGSDRQPPYFVMEFVDGDPLTEFAADNGLSLEARLTLFARVCDAVQHAHQKGVIHRDLKPANILVTDEESTATCVLPDGGSDAGQLERKSVPSSGTRSRQPTSAQVGQPKIVDFGIARVIDSDQQVATLETSVGELLGTLSYMSPEQVSGRTLDIDTRCDVYALGVVLYELLAGRLPYSFHGLAITEAVRIIQEEDPQQLGALNTECRGDIETIVNKAMAKERDRRYASANELAADVRRYLRREPIEARRATAFYQLRKFAARNKSLVGGVVATFVTLVAGLIGTLYWVQQAAQRQSQLQVVADFQGRMLDDIRVDEMGRQLLTDVRADVARILEEQPDDPPQSPEDFDSVLEHIDAAGIASRLLDKSIVARAAQAVDREFADQPGTAAELRMSLGRVYSTLGLYKKAHDEFNKAAAIRRAELGADDPQTLLAERDAALMLAESGQASAAEPILRSVLERLQSRLGDAHPDTIETLYRLGDVQWNMSEFEAAEEALRSALAHARQSLGELHTLTLSAMSSLGGLCRATSRLEEAETLLRTALENSRKALGDDHPDTLSRMTSLALLLASQRRYEEAEPLLVEVRTRYRTQFGEDHPNTLSAAHNLGQVYTYLKEYEAAEPLLRESLEGRRRVLGRTHPAVLRSLNALAGLLRGSARRQDAIDVLRDSYTVAQRTLGRHHNTTSVAALNLATVHKELGEFEEALRFAQEGQEIRSEVFGAEHYRTIATQEIQSQILLAAGRYEECSGLLGQTHEQVKAINAEGTPLHTAVISRLALAYIADDRAADAEPLCRELLAICKQGESPNITTIGLAERLLATSLIPQEKYEESEALLEDAELHLRDQLPEEHWHVQYARALRGAAIAAQGRHREAESCLVEGAAAVLGQIDQIKIDERQLIRAQLDEYLARFSDTIYWCDTPSKSSQ